MPARVVDVLDYRLDLQEEVRAAGTLLREGRLLVLPTETVYGIAGKLDTAARQTLLTLRGDRPGSFAPHLPDAAAARQFLGDVSDMGARLMSKLWPGPVALTFAVEADRRREVAAGFGVEEKALYDNGQIVLRCPDEMFTASVLRAAGQPIVLTRAGLVGADAGRPPRLEELPPSVAAVFDAGQTRFTKASTVIKVEGDAWQVVRPGVFDGRIIERLLRTTVLFVCSGNTCRSPMAAALARKLIAEKLHVSAVQIGDKGFDVLSAGTFAMPGMRATPQAADAVAEMGADLSSHRSQPLSVELIHQADAVITMGRAHAQAVTSLVPAAAGKTLTLDPAGDIEDPIGADGAHYRKLAAQIEAFVRDRLGETVFKSS